MLICGLEMHLVEAVPLPPHTNGAVLRIANIGAAPNTYIVHEDQEQHAWQWSMRGLSLC